MSIRNKYEEELKEIKLNLISMGAEVERIIREVVAALMTKDSARAASAIKAEKDIRFSEAMIEKKCFTILLRQQPVAKDFREVSAVLKIITDLERIAHQASDIAEMVMNWRSGNTFPEEKFSEMSQLALEMVHLSLEAYVHSDTELAQKVFYMDDRLDELFISVTADMVEAIKKENADVDADVLFMMIAKYMERIGDHSVNISDWVVYYTTGKHIKR